MKGEAAASQDNEDAPEVEETVVEEEVVEEPVKPSFFASLFGVSKKAEAAPQDDQMIAEASQTTEEAQEAPEVEETVVEEEVVEESTKPSFFAGLFGTSKSTGDALQEGQAAVADNHEPQSQDITVDDPSVSEAYCTEKLIEESTEDSQEGSFFQRLFGMIRKPIASAQDDSTIAQSSELPHVEDEIPLSEQSSSEAEDIETKSPTYFVSEASSLSDEGAFIPQDGVDVEQTFNENKPLATDEELPVQDSPQQEIQQAAPERKEEIHPPVESKSLLSWLFSSSQKDSSYVALENDGNETTQDDVIPQAQKTEDEKNPSSDQVSEEDDSKDFAFEERPSQSTNEWLPVESETNMNDEQEESIQQEEADSVKKEDAPEEAVKTFFASLHQLMDNESKEKSEGLIAAAPDINLSVNSDSTGVQVQEEVLPSDNPSEIPFESKDRDDIRDEGNFFASLWNWGASSEDKSKDVVSLVAESDESSAEKEELQVQEEITITEEESPIAHEQSKEEVEESLF